MRHEEPKVFQQAVAGKIKLLKAIKLFYRVFFPYMMYACISSEKTAVSGPSVHEINTSLTVRSIVNLCIILYKQNHNIIYSLIIYYDNTVVTGLFLLLLYCCGGDLNFL